MEFRDSYFEDEVKSGYYVDGRMKCCWAAQLEVLHEIDRICTKHNIKYFAEWGSLLGTIRHEGYIPWDDDFDISMIRPDYEKFIKIAPKELPSGYDLLNYRDHEDYYDVMSRVLNIENPCFDDAFLEKYHNMPYVIGVDIFPLDYFPKDESLVDIQRELIDYVKSVADIQGHEPDKLFGETLENCLQKIERLCNRKIDRNKDLKTQLYKIVCGLYAIYSEEESDRIALMPLYMENGGAVYPKGYYADSIRMPFENTTIPVPIGYDYMLRHKYGDYMKNVRKGGSHDYPYFEDQERYCKAKGVNIPTFQYSDVKTDLKKKQNFIGNISLKLELLCKIHESLSQLLKIADVDNTLKLVSECQNIAVSMGEALEKKVRDTKVLEEKIKLLEEYCAALYEIYNMVFAGEKLEGEGVKNLLNEVLSQFIDLFTAEPLKKEIVFMVVRSTQWRAIESVYKKVKEDINNDVKVVPLPYFYKKSFGRKFSDIRDDRDEFPDYVDVIPYEDYSLENNHPDVIYIQQPYDEWNYTTMVHPDYFCDKLWTNTERLIYIPWFKIDEMSPDDERGLKSRNFFVPMPGVVYSDEVILQSEAMRESYIEYLCDWAGEETKEIWANKLIAGGSPLDDIDEIAEAKKSLPEDMKNKKLLLYHITANALQEHKYATIRKIESTMKIFEKNADNIIVLWLQDDGIKERLKNREPKILKEYEQLVMKYKNKTWVRFYEPSEKELPLKVADAYYGDGGRYAQVIRMNGRPVMLQDVKIE